MDRLFQAFGAATENAHLDETSLDRGTTRSCLEWREAWPGTLATEVTNSVSSHMYPENPEGTQVIVGCINMGYDIIISDTARNRTHNLFCPKCVPIPLGHSDRSLLNLEWLFNQFEIKSNIFELKAFVRLSKTVYQIFSLLCKMLFPIFIESMKTLYN